MISVEQNQSEPGLKITKAARLAIANGVQRGDAVAELEYLGLSVRTINLLENSNYGITKLEQLVCRSREELLEIANITPGVVTEIMSALARYDQLSEVKQKIHLSLDQRLRWFDQLDSPPTTDSTSES